VARLRDVSLMTEVGGGLGARLRRFGRSGPREVKTAALARTLLFPALGALVCTLLVSLVAANLIQRHWFDRSVQRTDASFANVFSLKVADDVGLMEQILDEISNRRPDIRNSFVARQREELLEQTKAYFANIRQRYEITHFYFSDANREVFLRVHQPERRGDVLERFTTLQAERTGESAAGIELGVLGTLTLRVVVPWREQGELLGYIELGKEIDSIIGDVHRSLGVGISVYVDKQLLNREEWAIGRALLDRGGNWDTVSDHVLIASYGAELVPEQPAFQGRYRDSEVSGMPYLEQQVDDPEVVASIHPLRDASGKQIGHFLIGQDVSQARQAHRAELVLLAIAYTAVFALLFLLLSRRTRNIAADIAHAQAELQAANADLRELDQRKTDFLSTVSHELRTPLTCILSAASIIERQAEARPEVNVRFGQTISLEGKRLGRLIDDLLDLTRIESGQTEWNVATVAVESVVDQVVEVCAAATLAQGIRLETQLPQTLPPAWCDADRLNQVLTNILNNAMKFTPEGGRIAITVVEQGTSLLFSVCDTGVGIPDAELERVFERFHQVAATTHSRSKPAGTGLGLAICRDIIEWHGGRIWAEPMRPRGLTVYFTVPIAAKTADLAQSALA